MAHQIWKKMKRSFCERVGCEVDFEAELAVPTDILPDQSARIIAHRCSDADRCNAEDKASCIWAGTNPLYDPFQDSSTEK